jgi:hypothetical protein
MSMNFFFKAFAADQIAAMQQNAQQIDAWVLEDKKFSAEMDVGSAWHVLQTALEGTGFDFDSQVDAALFNGCMLVSPDSVARQAKALQDWTPQRLLDAVAELGADAELYHAEVWADEDNAEELLGYFSELQQFYAQAAQQQWGMVIYAA